MKPLPAVLILLFLGAACTSDAPVERVVPTPPLGVPAWAKDVVWYQIFVERFRNGDPSNDPALHDIEGAWPHAQPEGWAPTPWTHDWYRQEPWAVATGEDFYYTAQIRRYGGDLQGVLDRLDYLQDLGVTALYLHPINDAPSLHKYDARTYRHIDRNFGPDPRGDEALIAAEDPTDPATWQWTAADRLFELPELKKIGRPEGQHHGAIEGTLLPPVREHIFNVTRRWLDPDGDPADGIDGFRLDVAEMVPLGFWRQYRAFARGINPEAYLVGEVWWDAWPDRMMPPAPWLQGDVFDAVMNYRWYMPTRSFFAGAPPHLTATAYVAHLDSVAAGFGPDFLKAMMNLTASHDSPRFATSVYNPGPYKYRVNPLENAGYKLDRPDARTRQIQQMILVQQFTYIGAPHIWNGDEVGMWGADDPDARKPLIWGDLTYEDEVAHPFGGARRRDAVSSIRNSRSYFEVGKTLTSIAGHGLHSRSR